MTDYRKKTVRAAGWAVGLKFVSQIVSFAIGIVLARLLVPDDFGLIAMVSVFTFFASLMLGIGFSEGLIQKKDATEDHFNSVFWLLLCLGGGISLVIYVSAPFMSSFYDRPEVEDICKILAIGIITGALSVIPNTRFAKQLEFKKLSIIEFLAMLIAGIVAIAMAGNGFGYWSLVASLLIRSVIVMVLTWVISGWKPAFIFKLSAIKDIFGFSLKIYGTHALGYVAVHIDKLLLGKYEGGESLGLYDKAYGIMLFPITNISNVITSVMFPSLSLIQTDVERVRRVYLRTVGAVSLLIFPMLAGMIAISETFVYVVLGNNWLELSSILQLFCIVGVPICILNVSQSVFASQGAVGLQLKIKFIMQPIYIVAIVIGLGWGVEGVIGAVVIARTIEMLIVVIALKRVIQLVPLVLLCTVAPSLGASIVMGVGVWAARPISGVTNEVLVLLMQLIVGIVLYLAILVAFRVKAFHDVLNVVLEQLKRKGETGNA